MLQTKNRALTTEIDVISSQLTELNNKYKQVTAQNKTLNEKLL